MGKREYTPERAAANRKWNTENYTKIGVDVPKDMAEQFKAKCKETNTKQRQILLDAITKFLES